MSQDNQSSQNEVLMLYQKLDKIEEKLENKLDKLDGRVDGVDKELAIYNEQLKVHIEGVMQAREENALLKNYIDIETEKIRADLKPVVDHINHLKNIVIVSKKLAGWVSAVIVFVYTVLQLMGKR